MSRKVTYAKVHAEIWVPGLGGLGTTLPSQSKNVVESMIWNGDLIVSLKGGRTVLVPSANVAFAELGKEELSETKQAA